MGTSEPKARTVRIERPPDADGVGVFRIDVGDNAQFYTFLEIRCDIGGRGFAVHRLGQGELYHVRVGVPGDMSCECMGFLRWDKCKHVSGLLALIRKGALPRMERGRRPKPTAPLKTDGGSQ